MTVPLENVRGFACVQPKRRSRTCALTLKDERQSWAGRELVGMPSGIPSAERAYRLRVLTLSRYRSAWWEKMAHISNLDHTFTYRKTLKS